MTGYTEAPSPNFDARRGPPDMVVLHYTGMADGASARDRLCDPEAEVSAHWLVHEDGRTEALVPEDRRDIDISDLAPALTMVIADRGQAPGIPR